jgi:hypothetical protein
MNGTVYVRHEFSKQTELLHLMGQLGIRHVLVGIESFLDDNLSAFDKHQTFTALRQSIATFKQHGFLVSGTFIMGAGRETPVTAASYLRVARELKLDLAYFFAYSLYPQMCGEGMGADRLFLEDLSYGTGHFVFFFPERIRPSRLQRELLNAHLGFYSWGRMLRNALLLRWQEVVRLILHRRLFLRLRPLMRTYVGAVEKLERGLYRGGVLDEIALRGKQIPRHPCFEIPQATVAHSA